ncbi:hypothetical protein DRN46_02485 [Thermococci archaeon]|nr:MAG: hypothetical protein DRN46_02485 [Thermococci archaeon]
MRKFCYRCGKEDVKLIDGLCDSCFLEKNYPEIPEIKVEKCPVCNSVRKGRKWIKSSLEELLMGEIKRKTTFPGKILELMVTSISDGSYSVEMTLSNTSGSVFSVELEGKIDLTEKICPECSKLLQGVHTAKVQLRGFKEEELASILDLTNSIEFNSDNPIVEIKQRKEGLDLMFLSLGDARKFVREVRKRYGVEIKESKRLVGRDRSTGKNKYKFTISVRIKLREGERVKLDGRDMLVKRVSRDKVVLVDRRGRERTYPVKRVMRTGR